MHSRKAYVSSSGDQRELKPATVVPARYVTFSCHIVLDLVCGFWYLVYFLASGLSFFIVVYLTRRT